MRHPQEGAFALREALISDRSPLAAPGRGRLRYQGTLLETIFGVAFFDLGLPERRFCRVECKTIAVGEKHRASRGAGCGSLN